MSLYNQFGMMIFNGVTSNQSQNPCLT